MPTAGDTVDVNGTTYTYGGARQRHHRRHCRSDRRQPRRRRQRQPAGGRPAATTSSPAHPGNAKRPCCSAAAPMPPASISPSTPPAARRCARACCRRLQFTVSKQGTGIAPAITFSADGLPGDVRRQPRWRCPASSAAPPSMDGTSRRRTIALDFGSLDDADGITQLSAEFTPNFIEQDGARFGIFSGVTICSDGLVSALFDNGERRPIYRIPLVTFVNPDGLEAKTGNVWTHHRGLRQSDPAHRRQRAGRPDRAVVAGSLDRRYRPGVHQHDRRPARLLGRHAGSSARPTRCSTSWSASSGRPAGRFGCAR